jgi:hypothetical protein
MLALTGDERVVAPLMARIPVSGRYVREKVVEGLALLDFVKSHQWVETGDPSQTLVRA